MLLHTVVVSACASFCAAFYMVIAGALNQHLCLLNPEATCSVAVYSHLRAARWACRWKTSTSVQLQGGRALFWATGGGVRMGMWPVDASKAALCSVLPPR